MNQMSNLYVSILNKNLIHEIKIPIYKIILFMNIKIFHNSINK